MRAQTVVALTVSVVAVVGVVAWSQSVDKTIQLAKAGDRAARIRLGRGTLIGLAMADALAIAASVYAQSVWTGARFAGIALPLLLGCVAGAAGAVVFSATTKAPTEKKADGGLPEWLSSAVWLASWAASELVVLTLGRPGMTAALGLCTGVMVGLSYPLATGVLRRLREAEAEDQGGREPVR